MVGRVSCPVLNAQGKHRLKPTKPMHRLCTLHISPKYSPFAARCATAFSLISATCWSTFRRPTGSSKADASNLLGRYQPIPALHQSPKRTHIWSLKQCTLSELDCRWCHFFFHSHWAFWMMINNLRTRKCHQSLQMCKGHHFNAHYRYR